jgi:hypothetical protein
VYFSYPPRCPKTWSKYSPPLFSQIFPNLWSDKMNNYTVSHKTSGATRSRSWLGHYATSRNVAGSIRDGVIGIFNWLYPSGRIMTPGSTQHITGMSTINISWGERRPVLRANKLSTFMCRLFWNLVTSITWSSQGLSRPVHGSLYRCSQQLHTWLCTVNLYCMCCGTMW